MATIKNKRKLVDVTISGENYTLQGEVQLDGMNEKVTGLSLVFRKNADADTKGFAGQVNLSVNTFNVEEPVDRVEIITLLAQVIQELNEGNVSYETQG